MSRWIRAFAVGASVARLAMRKSGIVVCLRCGSPTLSKRSRNHCDECRTVVNERSRKNEVKRHKRNVKNGKCFCCGKSPPQKGRVRCRKCLDKILKNVNAYNQRRKLERASHRSQ